MQNGEQPGADVAIAPLVPAADGTLRAILDQIVGSRTTVKERVCVAAERGDQRLDLN
jgi:hypothetical protein